MNFMLIYDLNPDEVRIYRKKQVDPEEAKMIQSCNGLYLGSDELTKAQEELLVDPGQQGWHLCKSDAILRLVEPTVVVRAGCLL